MEEQKYQKPSLNPDDTQINQPPPIVSVGSHGPEGRIHRFGAVRGKAHRVVVTLKSNRWTSTVGFLFLCMVAGVFTGLVGGYFQYFLHIAERWRGEVAAWAQTVGFWQGFLTLLVIGMGAAVIGRFLVRFAPTAGGSGIQYVEAMWHNEVDAAHLKVLFVKFFGGLLTLGSGMALGREGPTVQMGAAVGAFCGRVCKLTRDNLKLITIASAGTGLGVAFSAPLGGAMFAFEEVTKDIELKLVVPTLLCVVAGTSISMTILGEQPDYYVINKAFEIPDVIHLCFYLLFGVFIGVMGALYNWLIIALLKVNDWFRWLPAEVKAALVGIVTAILLWLVPDWTGGGDKLADYFLNVNVTIEMVIIIGLIRWFFAPLCYSTGVPGGLFSPLLLMGGILGHLFVWPFIWLGADLNPLAFCAVGMAAFFGSTIRAPTTGVLLILEMTACWNLTIPMVAASAVSFMTAKLMNCLPIYSALRLRIPSVHKLEEEGQNVLFD
ncbi:MAG: ClC family H(+)/Cl(-) exchange transporter [Burkholderiales bacterium]|nr:ClC family H(+)/Cl(-) exchange transporter [Burkholderiales bacterium]